MIKSFPYSPGHLYPIYRKSLTGLVFMLLDTARKISLGHIGPDYHCKGTLCKIRIHPILCYQKEIQKILVSWAETVRNSSQLAE